VSVSSGTGLPNGRTKAVKRLCVCVFCVSFNNFGFALLVSFVGFGFSSTEPRDRLGRTSPK